MIACHQSATAGPVQYPCNRQTKHVDSFDHCATHISNVFLHRPGHGCASTLSDYALPCPTVQMTTDSTTSDLPQDLGALTQHIHMIHTHRFSSQSPSSIVRSIQPKEISLIGPSRPTKVRAFLQSGTYMTAKWSPDLDLTNVEFSSLPSGLHLVEEDVVYAYYLPLPSLFSKNF